MARVAVIGAGPSGLVATKCCLEAGLEVSCFEESSEIGGIWCFTEDKNRTSVCKSTVMNTSREMSVFSDFPPPKTSSTFLHHAETLEYLQFYAERFDLKKYIDFNSKVINVQKNRDKGEEKYWVTCEKYTKEGMFQKRELFDMVLVCNGHHRKPHMPTFDGMDNFEGTKLHSQAYKDFHPFKDKVVVVVGIANTGSDIAVELSRHAQKVYLSTRRGTWVFNRYCLGLPLDQMYSRRIIGLLPRTLFSQTLAFYLNTLYDHRQLGLQPKTGPLAQHPVINDELPVKLSHGVVNLKPNIDLFEETGIVFEDGTRLHGVDAVIFATGYEITFSFLEPGLITFQENQPRLYKYVFPPDHQNLAVIGCCQPAGSIMPLSELQARWALRVFTNKCQLPSKNTMIEDIVTKWTRMKETFYKSRRHTIEVNYVEYADELAKEIGCYPSVSKLIVEDPILALRCLFGPTYPYQYRLVGPDIWRGARTAILKAGEDSVWTTRYLMEIEKLNKMTKFEWVSRFLLQLVTVIVFPGTVPLLC